RGHRPAGGVAPVSGHLRPRDSCRVAVAPLRRRGFRLTAAYPWVYLLSHAVRRHGTRAARRAEHAGAGRTPYPISDAERRTAHALLRRLHAGVLPPLFRRRGGRVDGLDRSAVG